MENIGIDVHKKESQLCIITEAGEVIEQRIRTERGRFSEVLGKRPQAKVLMEASTESEWVARCLEEMGHAVVVADPNFAPMYGTRTRRVKTDRRDARALADACLSSVGGQRDPQKVGPSTALPRSTPKAGYFFAFAFFDSSAVRRRYDLPSMGMMSA